MIQPVRVLNVVGLMSPGGIESLIMNIYRNIDRDRVQFDFLTHKGTDGTYDEEILRLGGRIYKMPALRDGEKTYFFRLFEYIAALKTFFRMHPEYRVLHGHMTNTAAIYMPIARKYGGVTCRIAHSHLTQARPGLAGRVTDLLHKRVVKVATDYFACSEMAAHWIFPDDVIRNGRVKIIRNGVDPERFRYDPQKSAHIRHELGLDGRYVIGNVARFKTEKNHTFQLDIIEQLRKTMPECILLLIGDGELRKETEDKVRRLGLEENVRFLGVRQDVNELMQAMDAFLLPSLYEGLPVVAVEAQASGLPIFASTGITPETDITGNVRFLDLPTGVHIWAEAIGELRNHFFRADMTKIIRERGYDITQTAKWLEAFYLKKSSNA